MVDVSICVLSTWIAIYLRLGEFIALSNINLVVVVIPSLMAISIFFVFGLYREIFRYSGLKVLATVSRAIFIYSIFHATFISAIGISEVPRTVGVIQPVLMLLLVGLSRVFIRQWLGVNERLDPKNRKKVLIYGAGKAGRQLANAIENSAELLVAGFLDDDKSLHGQSLNGLQIYDPAKLMDLSKKYGVNDVYLAMPTVGGRRRNAILNRIKDAKVSVRILPSLIDLAEGRVTVSDLRELDIDELLGRAPVKPNQILMGRTITHKTVMVTGAGGSIGSELCKQIIILSPEKLLLVEQNELALYEINKQLETYNEGVSIIPLLASVQNKSLLKKIMEKWRPSTVYHAAAYKHVPLVEQNIIEGIKNNVFGTLAPLEVSIEYDVDNFVLVSTDKAVRPTNLMGASKRLAEMSLQARAESKPFTTLSMVRFGNVLGSSGSVALRFREQIRAGGPITLTHPEITRFFMTVSEAAQLVIQAGSMSKGGDLFVLDMGEPAKILTLAKRMTELSGLTIKDQNNPDGDIEIEIIGLRPGEKLYEELLIGDGVESTSHPKILRAKEEFVSWEEFTDEMVVLNEAINLNDIVGIQAVLKRLVDGYLPEEQVADLTLN
tara:strand:- start:7091 stop:8911 length:1821 start_codon:yes stop_codon:yes gene_type:complete